MEVEATVRGWRVSPGPIAAPRRVVEPDLSNAAPFLAAALVTGGRVTVRDWPEVTTQPGAPARPAARPMGAEVTRAAEGLQVTGTGAIRPLVADLGEVGELTPVLAALCALADGPSRLTGIGHLRGHETDRLQALDEVLTAVGARVEQLPDGLVIEPGPRRPALLGLLRRPPDGARRPPSSGWGSTGVRAGDPGAVDQDAARLRRALGRPARRARGAAPERPPARQPVRRGRRPRPARARAVPGRARAPGRLTTTPSTGWSSRSTAAG